MHAPVRTIAPAVRVITPEDLHARLRLDHDDHAPDLVQLVITAEQLLDGWSGTLKRCLINQTWAQSFDGWATCLRLPFSDVSSVVIKYLDEGDVEQTVSATDYQLLQDATGSFIRFRDSFTSPGLSDDVAAITVTMVAGYGAAPVDVPYPIRRAIILHSEAIFDGLPEEDWRAAYNTLIGPYRRLRL